MEATIFLDGRDGPAMETKRIRNFPSDSREVRTRYRQEQRRRSRDYVRMYLKTHPCLDCKESDPIVLDFDHRDPSTKYRSISQIIAHNLGINKLIEEIEKCDVRCANCHRRKHYKETHNI